MISVGLGCALGLAVAGPLGALFGAAIPLILRSRRHAQKRVTPVRLVLLLLVVELRSGLSVLASLQEVSKVLPHEEGLRRVTRVATVSGLTSAMEVADPDLLPIVAQLARAQRTGGSLSSTVRSMLDQNLAIEKARRLASARALPVRLMLPVTLLMLPGLVLLLYAPALLSMFGELTGRL